MASEICTGKAVRRSASFLLIAIVAALSLLAFFCLRHRARHQAVPFADCQSIKIQSCSAFNELLENNDVVFRESSVATRYYLHLLHR